MLSYFRLTTFTRTKRGMPSCLILICLIAICLSLFIVYTLILAYQVNNVNTFLIIKIYNFICIYVFIFNTNVGVMSLRLITLKFA